MRCRLGWILGAGLLTEMVMCSLEPHLGQVLAALSLQGLSLDLLWVDTEAADAHVVTVLSSGPGLVTAGGMAYEGRRFICGMSPEMGQ